MSTYLETMAVGETFSLLALLNDWKWGETSSLSLFNDDKIC